jgi:uncharacterized membrane protein YdjX (TVP38/TMEM64 family)
MEHGAGNEDATMMSARGEKIRSSSGGEKTRRRVLVATGLLFAIAIGWFLRARTGVEWDVEMARGLVEEMGFWAPAIFILVVTFRLMILVPSQVMLTVGGICFGFLWGTVYGAVGVTLSGLVAFGLARYLGGDALRRRVSPGLRRILDMASRRTGALVVAIGTAYPVGPLTGYHIGAGLTCMSLSLYLSALALGALIRASLFTFLGSRIAEVGIREAWPAVLILAVLCLPLLHPTTRTWVANRLRHPGDTR